MVQLFPSLSAANPLELGTVIATLDPYVDGYHIDVMDFHFVHNLAMGPDTVNAIRTATNKQLLVHLMVDYPERYLDLMKLRQGDVISIHPESPSDLSLKKLILAILHHSLIPSLAFSPEIPIGILETLEVPLNHLLLMAVQPGFSGQKFMPMVYARIEEVKKIAKQSKRDYTIAIDGGVSNDNAHKLMSAGAEQLIIGSALFSTNDYVKAAKELKASLFL